MISFESSEAQLAAGSNSVAFRFRVFVGNDDDDDDDEEEEEEEELDELLLLLLPVEGRARVTAAAAAAADDRVNRGGIEADATYTNKQTNNNKKIRKIETISYHTIL